MPPKQQNHVICEQKPHIEKLGETISDFKEDLKSALDRMETRDDRIIEALEKIANQDGRLPALEESSTYQKGVAENSIRRIGDMEQVMGKDGATLTLFVDAAVTHKIEEINRNPFLIASVTIILTLVIVGTSDKERI